LKLKYDELISTFCFSFNLRRCIMGTTDGPRLAEVASEVARHGGAD